MKPIYSQKRQNKDHSQNIYQVRQPQKKTTTNPDAEVEQLKQKIKEMEDKLNEKQIKQTTTTVTTEQQKQPNQYVSLSQTEQDEITKYLMETKNATSTPTKRPAISSASSEESTKIDTTEDKISVKVKKQKPDTPSQDKIDNHLKNVKSEIQNNPGKYILSYEELLHFLENCQGNKEKTLLANEYTNDIPKLITMLQDLYKFIADRKIKSRFTRLINKLNPELNNQHDNAMLEL